MLSLFPELFIFGFLATGILRAVLGIIFIRFGYLKLTSDREAKAAFFEDAGLRPGMFFAWLVGVVELVGGILLLIGLFTQAAALLMSFLMAGAVVIKLRNPASLPSDTSFYILLFITTLALAFLGPGAFAFDLPL